MSQELESTFSLTLEPEVETAVPQPAPAPEPEKPEVQLTPQEQKMVDDFAAKIDLTKSEQVFAYGAAAQKKIATFSETALNNVRTQDIGETGEMISSLMLQLKDVSTEEPEKGSFLGWFRNQKQKLEATKARYAKVETNVEKIVSVLEGHQIRLKKEVVMLDQMYQSNLDYFKEISMYILAGKQRLQQAKEVELTELLEKAQKSGLPEDSQAANDFSNLCDRFEKKVHDLELSRMVSLQMAPQIRMVQNNNSIMVEKIHSTLVNTIPLWKSQIVISLGMAHSQQALEAQRAVSDMTNELLRKNSEALKQGTVAVAKESERGIVDMETLKVANENLISTLDEVMQIQKDGRQKRREAEVELARLEEQLKQKLLNVR